METKEFKIQVPEGYEIDKENGTFECIKFKPIKKNMTYEDVAKRLFKNETYYVDYNGDIVKTDIDNEVVSLDSNNCTSEKQAEKLLAINKLLNVAKYLNGEWKPNWNDTSRKYYITYPNINDKFYVDFSLYVHSDFVYFESEELARQAMEILGEETIKTALSTDW